MVMSIFINLTDYFTQKSISIDSSKVVLIEEDQVTSDKLKGEPTTRVLLSMEHLDRGQTAPVRVVQEAPHVVQSKVDAARLEFEIRKEQILRQMNSGAAPS